MVNSVDRFLEAERRRMERDNLLLKQSGILETARLYEQSEALKLAKGIRAAQPAYLDALRSPAYSVMQDALKGYQERMDAVTGTMSKLMEQVRLPELTGIVQRVQELQKTYQAMIAPTISWQKQNIDNLTAITSASQRLANQLNEVMRPWSTVTEALRQNQSAIVSGFANMDRVTIEAYARAIYEEDELASLPDDQNELAESIFERLVSNTGDEVRTMGLIQLLLILFAVWQMVQGADYTDDDRARDAATHNMIEAISQVMDAEAQRIDAIEALPRAVVKASFANVRTDPNGQAELRWRLAENEGVFVESIKGRWVKVHYRNGALDALECGWVWRDSLVMGGGS